METIIQKRVLKEANYIIKTNSTIRQTASKFSLGKSTIYFDLASRLKKIDYDLYEKVNKIFKEHDKEKHLRGGMATIKKYKKR